jgi:hypothetical protein
MRGSDVFVVVVVRFRTAICDSVQFDARRLRIKRHLSENWAIPLCDDLATNVRSFKKSAPVRSETTWDPFI